MVKCHLAGPHGHSVLSPLFQTTRPLWALAAIWKSREGSVWAEVSRDCLMEKGNLDLVLKAGQGLLMRTKERCTGLFFCVPEPMALGVEPSNVCLRSPAGDPGAP